MVVCKKYGLTMFEIPTITINSLSKRLNDIDLKPKKKSEEDKMDKLFK